jgi:hypothetical protein
MICVASLSSLQSELVASIRAMTAATTRVRRRRMPAEAIPPPRRRKPSAPDASSFNWQIRLGELEALSKEHQEQQAHSHPLTGGKTEESDANYANAEQRC